ncbi:MAG: long-chain fatty acid--CoA ligase [SAR324 cluster bacterium]
MRTDAGEAPAQPASGQVSRRWHGAWPAHLPYSLAYPDVPVWWLLERNLPQYADRVAIRFLDHGNLAEREVLTYAELAGQARSLAAGLQRLGVRKGDRVALFLPNCPQLIVSYYGIWRAGGVPVPCNPMYKAAELTRQIGDAGARFLIAPVEAAAVASAAARETGVGMIRVGDAAAERETDPEPLPAVRFTELLASPAAGLREVGIEPGADLALLLYTGGTTGTPKGAMLTHRNLVANTLQFAHWYALDPGRETCVSAIPMFHSGGMAGAMNVPLYAGATLLVFSRFVPASVARAIERYRATRFFGVPAMYIALLNSEEARRCDYSSLRACRTNAAPLPASVKTAFDRLVGHEVLVEGYGLTETSPLTHANPIHRARAGSIGVPLPDTDAKIVNMATGEDLAPGETGEIVLRGPQVMKGYWQQPEATREAMRGGWFHTGDAGFMDAEGYFTVVDRMKDVINSAGYKVWPREVEEVLYQHPAIRLAVVTRAQDEYRGEVVKAYVVLKAQRTAAESEEALIAFCKERMAAYKVPRSVEFRDQLPMSGAGKLLRRIC